MTDKPEMPLTTFVGNASAPFIYFDVAPTLGVFNGAIQIELAGRTLLGGDTLRTEFVITGHLRCSPTAANDLIQALTKALMMLSPEGTPH